MTIKELRQQFPILGREVYGKTLVYFDNAATSQRPECVVQAIGQFHRQHNANTHRAVHALSSEATQAYEASRDKVKAFINAQSREEIIFTSGATAALNLVAYSFCERFVGPGDEIVVGEAEHHSNFVPWQQIASRKGAVVKYLSPGETDNQTSDAPWSGDLRYSVHRLAALLSERTKIVCIGQASNVLGLLNPVREICELCHSRGIPVMVDGAQGIVHSKVDVQELGCDFYAFSAHKMYGPTGVGVLYGRKNLLEQLPPFLFGGEMVGSVSLKATTFAPLPLRFEAGTPNIAGVGAFGPAVEFADKLLKDRELNKELEAVCQFLETALNEIPGMHLCGRGDRGFKAVDRSDRLPIFSFNIDGVHHEDMALLLDKMGVAVRSGQMCAEPLMNFLGVTGLLRASLLPYNTMDEAEQFISCLHRAVDMLK